MPDNLERKAPAQTPVTTKSGTQPSSGHIPMTEEFDRAKWTLPPVGAVTAGIVIVGIVVAILLFTTRAKQITNGAIGKVLAVDQSSKQGDNVLVTVQIKFDNFTEKPLWIKEITSEMETQDGNKYPDHSAPKSDLARYQQAYPELEPGGGDPLGDDLKIPAGKSVLGVVAFSYPVKKDVFEARKALQIKIRFYDWPSLELKQ